MQFDLAILGGGQLARMTIMAAQRMGLQCISIDPASDSPAAAIAPAATADMNDPEALARVISAAARVTLENEFIPAHVIRLACKMAGRDESIITPGLETLATIQDKLHQREALHKAGLPVPKATALSGDGTTAVARIGFPAILKSRHGGYDGKGTRYVEDSTALTTVLASLPENGWLAEEYVPFARELAVMVYRSKHDTGCFPTMETVQTDHVCDLVLPAESDASGLAVAAVEAVGGYGLFGVEIFELADGKMLVNEIAPRPHNSGHYSMDWGGPSQFEHCVRLALGIPLAPVDGVPTCMANLLGKETDQDWRRGLQALMQKDPGAYFHWYGKSESRPGRKMGHINVHGPNLVERAKAAREAFYTGWVGTKNEVWDVT